MTSLFLALSAIFVCICHGRLLTPLSNTSRSGLTRLALYRSTSLTLDHAGSGQDPQTRVGTGWLPTAGNVFTLIGLRRCSAGLSSMASTYAIDATTRNVSGRHTCSPGPQRTTCMTLLLKSGPDALRASRSWRYADCGRSGYRLLCWVPGSELRLALCRSWRQGGRGSTCRSLQNSLRHIAGTGIYAPNTRTGRTGACSAVHVYSKANAKTVNGATPERKPCARVSAGGEAA